MWNAPIRFPDRVAGRSRLRDVRRARRDSLLKREVIPYRTRGPNHRTAGVAHRCSALLGTPFRTDLRRGSRGFEPKIPVWQSGGLEKPSSKEWSDGPYIPGCEESCRICNPAGPALHPKRHHGIPGCGHVARATSELTGHGSVKAGRSVESARAGIRHDGAGAQLLRPDASPKVGRCEAR
jgi:hypothetical protein